MCDGLVLKHPADVPRLAAYIIFAVWDALLVVVIYLFAVETKQLTLEEMDSVFEARSPVKHSLEIARSHKERQRATSA